jgi:hypothetical protein
MINGVRYRGAIPEAQTKREAADVESKVRHSVFEGTYGRKAPEQAGTSLFTRFVEEVFLPWARDNKKSWRNDEDRDRVLCEYFKKLSTTHRAAATLAVARC